MIKHGDIAAIALARPALPALVSSERTITWQQYADEVAILAAGLQQRFDLSKVTQVAFVSENRVSLVLLLSAFSSLGITTTGIDYLLAPTHARNAIETIGADLLLVSTRQVGKRWVDEVTGGWQSPVIDLDDQLPDAVHWQALIESVEPGKTFVPPAARPFRAVAYTSGTSGSAKATLRTRSGDARRFHYFTTRYALHADDRYLLTIPLYHVAGNGWARHFLSIGASVFIVDVAQPEQISHAIRTQGITSLVTTPIVLTRLLDDFDIWADSRHEASNDATNSSSTVTASAGSASAVAAGLSLRFLVVGGKNFSPSQKRRALRMLGPVVYEYYGSTETGVNAIAEPADLLSHPESVGLPYAGQRVLAIDAQGNALPIGAAGRLAVSSFLLMDGYIGTENHEVLIDGERFLITPDSGYVGTDGRVYVLNRAAGGVADFDAYAVEERVRTLVGVRDVALLIEPTAGLLPEKTDVLIALKEGDSTDVHGLLSQVRAVLKANKLESGVVRVVDRIPYSLSGKIRWPEVARLLAQPLEIGSAHVA